MEERRRVDPRACQDIPGGGRGDQHSGRGSRPRGRGVSQLDLSAKDRQHPQHPHRAHRRGAGGQRLYPDAVVPGLRARFPADVRRRRHHRLRDAGFPARRVGRRARTPYPVRPGGCIQRQSHQVFSPQRRPGLPGAEVPLPEGFHQGGTSCSPTTGHRRRFTTGSSSFPGSSSRSRTRDPWSITSSRPASSVTYASNP